MKIDVLVAEIGSTTTLVNGFADIDGEAHFVGQGQAPTSVLEGDVRKGLEAAREDLSRKIGSDIEYSEFLAASSAAGGLGMTVHGLVYDMTARAAQAAALGAGAVIRMTTAGKLTDFDLAEIRSIAPKLILLAGGTDHGERETALFNAHVLAGAGLHIPVIYAGNIQNRAAVKEIFAKAGVPLFITDNVYPKLDLLNIEPARRIIHRAFEENIVLAPGMEHIRDIVNGEIMPTPGAVMEAARFLYERIGDLVCFDVGGATTDVHSVTPGTEEIARIQTVPEPMAKRTVEGDLGCYVNAMNVAEQMGRERLAEEIGCREDELESLRKPIPESGKEFSFSEAVCRYAAKTALERHAGAIRYIYTPQGRKTLAEGKDLSAVKYIAATGGALTRLPHHREMMKELADMNKAGLMLYPKPGVCKLLFDTDYIMASAGVLSRRYPEAAWKLLKNSFSKEAPDFSDNIES